MAMPSGEGNSIDAVCDEIDQWVGPRRIYPISFCIPESVILDATPTKQQDAGTGISRGTRKYRFGPGEQQAYYEDYQSSFLGLTYRKGGWDCMRHLEIMANGCLPFFPGIDDCPRYTMAHYPKAMLAEHYRNYANAVTIQGTEMQFDPAKLSDWPGDYDAKVQALLHHTRKYLSTRAMAKYVLDKAGHADAKSVLFISGGKKPDYLCDLLFQGVRELLGAGCVDANKSWWVYDSASDQRVGQLYGNGFTYTRRLPDIDIDRRDIKQRIAKRAFDVVVFGAVRRCHDLLPHVRKHYEREEVILIDGEDSSRVVGWSKNENVPSRDLLTARRLPAAQIVKQGVYFKRELDHAAVIAYDTMVKT